MFAIVEFADKSCEVVPISWIDDDLCLFPPRRKWPYLEQYVKKERTPGNDWSFYAVNILKVYGLYFMRYNLAFK